MLALLVSVLIQRQLGYHRWRMLHLTGYLAFTLMCAHVLISGSDVGSPWVWGAVLVGWLSTLVLRLVTTRQAAELPRRFTDRVAARVRGRQVLVNVDPMRCARFGFCEQEAPDIFQLRGDGRLTYQPTVPAGRLEQAIGAARVCPARAIALTRAATTTVLPGDVLVREGTSR
jgi:sulfoxide reductase heme-binding subunit YedZ